MSKNVRVKYFAAKPEEEDIFDDKPGRRCKRLEAVARNLAEGKGVGYREATLAECKGIQCYKVYFDDEGRAVKMKVFDQRGEWKGDRFWHYPPTEPSECSRETIAGGVAYECDDETDDIAQTIRWRYRYPEDWSPPEGLPASPFYLDWGRPGEVLQLRRLSVRPEGAKRTGCVYDNEGRKLKEIYYDLDGSVGSTQLFYYDDQGRLVKHEFLLAGLFDEHLDSYKVFEHDDQSRVVQREEFTLDGQVVEVRRYAYTKQGNLAEEALHSVKTGDDVRTEYVYDEHTGLLRRIGHYRNEELVGKTCYGYDSAGRVILEERYDNQSTLESRDLYEYDSKGRLIREEQFSRFPKDY